MLAFIALFLLLIVVLPGIYALLVHLRDLREKAQDAAAPDVKV
jgi:hypothetical protein